MPTPDLPSSRSLRQLSLRFALNFLTKRGDRRPRKPGGGNMPVPAIPPRGPLPLQGGAEAPLEFGD